MPFLIAALLMAATGAQAQTGKPVASPGLPLFYLMGVCNTGGTCPNGSPWNAKPYNGNPMELAVCTRAINIFNQGYPGYTFECDPA